MARRHGSGLHQGAGSPRRVYYPYLTAGRSSTAVQRLFPANLARGRGSGLRPGCARRGARGTVVVYRSIDFAVGVLYGLGTYYYASVGHGIGFRWTPDLARRPGGDFLPVSLGCRAKGRRRSNHRLLCSGACLAGASGSERGQVRDQDVARRQHARLEPHARAVGHFVGHNPVSVVVPCHRVVGASGRLTGYAGGLERKEHLLRLEGALVETPLF